MASRAYQAWRVFVVTILVAAVGVPIYGAVFDGLGAIAGLYWGILLALIGLTAQGVTLALERVREPSRIEERTQLPRATVVRG